MGLPQWRGSGCSKDVDGAFPDRWRDYDSEDSLRFYALLLHQVGMVKSDPNQIIARTTDWRFFSQLKQELKA